jgi:hypothetical protein
VDRLKRTEKNKGKADGPSARTPSRAPRHITEIGPWLAGSEAVLRSLKQRFEDGTISPAELKLYMEFAYGRPRPMEEKKPEKPRMPFIGRRGLPWQNDPMALQEHEAILAQNLEEQRKMRMAQPQGKKDPEPAAGANDPPDLDTPQLVRPEDFP